MRKGNAAIAWGREQRESPTKDWTNLCLQFVRMCFGLGAVFPSARAAWEGAKLKHPTTDPNTIPRGVAVFWKVGEFWHVALSLGGGLCLSTDVKRRGRVDIVRIDAIRTAWGAQLLGWTEDLNGVRVWRNMPAAPAPPAADRPRNRVTKARAQLRVARRCIAIAGRLLDDVPDERKVVHEVADKLDQLQDALERRLDQLPPA